MSAPAKLIADDREALAALIEAAHGKAQPTQTRKRLKLFERAGLAFYVSGGCLPAGWHLTEQGREVVRLHRVVSS